MTKRNPYQELEEMGVEFDDNNEEHRELEIRERERQEHECRRQYLKDVSDFYSWMKKNKPTNHKLKRLDKASGGAVSPPPTLPGPSVGAKPGATPPPENSKDL